MRPVPRSLALLWPILGLAAVLRLWGLSFGLPYTFARPDEGRLVGTAADFITVGSLNPHFFSYPTLFPYAVGAVYAADCAARVVVRAFPTMSACAASWESNWGPLFLTARTVSALAGMGAVALVFFIGARLHPRAGPIAALLLSVAFLHVRDSHFGVTDVPMTSMLLLALLLLLRADEQPSLARFSVAGLTTGLAAATKYNAILLSASAAISQAGAWWRAAGSSRAKHTRLLGFAAAALVGFLMGTPYALLNRAEFVRDTTHESWHLLHWNAIPLDIGWRYHASLTLPQSVGWPLLLSGLIGMVWTMVKRPWPASMIFAFPLIYYVVAGRGQAVFVRYMIPVIPFLCLGAGAFIAMLYSRVAGRRARVALVVGVAVATLCAVPTGLKSAQLDRVLARTDSRVLATDWIAQHVRPGSSILMTGSGLQLWRQGQRLPYEVWSWEGDGARMVGAARARPDWLVLEQSPLFHYSAVPDELAQLLDEYILRRRIEAVDMTARLVYDQQDSFYVPLNGFEHVTRPGPNLLIYQRR